jgi:hypothetical protein
MIFIWLLAGSMTVRLARFRCASPGGFDMNAGNPIRRDRFGISPDSSILAERFMLRLADNLCGRMKQALGLARLEVHASTHGSAKSETGSHLRQ